MKHCEYVSKSYQVPADIGRRVIVDGRPGTIRKDKGAHIGVHFDDDPIGRIRVCHPTWRVEYGEMEDKL